MLTPKSFGPQHFDPKQCWSPFFVIPTFFLSPLFFTTYIFSTSMGGVPILQADNCHDLISVTTGLFCWPPSFYSYKMQAGIKTLAICSLCQVIHSLNRSKSRSFNMKSGPQKLLDLFVFLYLKMLNYWGNLLEKCMNYRPEHFIVLFSVTIYNFCLKTLKFKGSS